MPTKYCLYEKEKKHGTNKKHFKITSIVVLIFAGASLLNLISELTFGDLNAVKGVSADILFITKIILLSVSFVLLLPQVYIGVKGLRIAKNPSTSKGHIIWAMILFAFLIICLIDPILGMINKENTHENMATLLGIAVEASVYYDYIKYGRAVLKETEQK